MKISGIGFHAPGMLGRSAPRPPGAADAAFATRDGECVQIAGSLANGCGVREGAFRRKSAAASRRAAEAGVTAARLAQRSTRAAKRARRRFGCWKRSARTATRPADEEPRASMERAALKELQLACDAQVQYSSRGWIEHGFRGRYRGNRLCWLRGCLAPQQRRSGRYHAGAIHVPFDSAERLIRPLDRACSARHVGARADLAAIQGGDRVQMWGGRMVVTLRDVRIRRSARKLPRPGDADVARSCAASSVALRTARQAQGDAVRRSVRIERLRRSRRWR